ncbi:hypothetical protein NDU88_002459 [Pleurodeles waltl]|uniref:Uncharacterized protein n=1 Tax=Pleurodeles waltl TaxID=8319 RepID=A0AAV7QCQ0_PLEWA|nr:hypothetical protein NDU88_002459 [Pleurodeles waltl]
MLVTCRRPGSRRQAAGLSRIQGQEHEDPESRLHQCLHHRGKKNDKHRLGNVHRVHQKTISEHLFNGNEDGIPMCKRWTNLGSVKRSLKSLVRTQCIYPICVSFAWYQRELQSVKECKLSAVTLKCQRSVWANLQRRMNRAQEHCGAEEECGYFRV